MLRNIIIFNTGSMTNTKKSEKSSKCSAVVSAAGKYSLTKIVLILPNRRLENMMFKHEVLLVKESSKWMR